MDRVAVIRLLQLFIDILLLRAGPQDVPASRVLLAAVLAASLTASALLALETFPAPTAMVATGLELVLTAALLALLLGLSGHGARFVQTFTALCGTGALLALLAWPLFGIVMGRPADDGLGLMAMLMLWGLYAWSILVIGHILRHALEIGLMRGMLFALAYVLLVAGLGEWLMPAPEIA